MTNNSSISRGHPVFITESIHFPMCRSSLCAGMITDTYGVVERGLALFIGSA